MQHFYCINCSISIAIIAFLLHILDGVDDDFDSTGTFLSGTLNRVNKMLGSGRNNRKLMCYVAGGVVVFIIFIYYVSSKLSSSSDSNWRKKCVLVSRKMANMFFRFRLLLVTDLFQNFTWKQMLKLKKEKKCVSIWRKNSFKTEAMLWYLFYWEKYEFALLKKNREIEII